MDQQAPPSIPLASLPDIGAAPQVTLLFAHGGSFCKQIWEPIVRRLQESKLLQQVPTRIVTFDFPYHGSKNDNSVAPQVHAKDSQTPHVVHPASAWREWGPEAVYAQIQKLRRKQEENKLTKPKLIGIGHSMGAASMWLTEVQHPGTFDGLVLFEPIYGVHSPHDEKLASFLVAVALKRETKWESREAAIKYFGSYRNFAAWDRECLAAYLKGALVPEEDAHGPTVLAIHPHIEASLYCGRALHLSEDEISAPKCTISLQSGKRSHLFARPFFTPMIENHSHIYRLAAPIPGASHLMVLENPEESAARILEELTQLASFSVE